MRYFIFSLFVLCSSCTLFRHPEATPVVTTKTVETTETVLADTKHNDLSTSAVVAIPETDIIVNPSFNVSSVSVSGMPYIWSGYPHSWATDISPYLLVNVALATPATVDTLLAAPGLAADTSKATLVKKVIPKSTAAILPESKSSGIPYIVSGIALVFVCTLFFALLKRKKKNKVSY